MSSLNSPSSHFLPSSTPLPQLLLVVYTARRPVWFVDARGCGTQRVPSAVAKALAAFLALLARSASRAFRATAIDAGIQVALLWLSVQEVGVGQLSERK